MRLRFLDGVRPAALVLALAIGLAGIAFVTLATSGRGAGGDRDTGWRAPTPPAGPRTRVEVLNAAGRAGLARAATERLRAQGFDVVYFGNASGFGRDSSIVLDRAGDPAAAAAVAKALGIPTVRSEPDPGLYLEVTVILGLDWPPEEPRSPRGRGAGRGQL